MSDTFRFSDYKEYDLYHIRLGRGAVIVAVKKNPENAVNSDKVISDKYIAQYFCSRDQSLDGNPQQLDPVLSVKEQNGMVEIQIAFERRHKVKPNYRPVKATIKRVLPVNQVSLEIVEKNESA